MVFTARLVGTSDGTGWDKVNGCFWFGPVFRFTKVDDCPDMVEFNRLFFSGNPIQVTFVEVSSTKIEEV